MKSKLLSLTFTLLFCVGFSFAQTSKGNLMIGGSAGFDNEFLDDDDALTVELSPQVGYFLMDNFALGGALNLGFTKLGDIKTRTVGLSPFARYYFGSSNARLFLHGQVGFLRGAVKIDDEKATASGMQLYLGPGLAFFLNEHVAVEGILGYTNNGGDFDYENIGLRIGVQAYLGGE